MPEPPEQPDMRPRAEHGQGLVEMVVALGVLAVAVTAFVAILASTAVSVQHSSQRGTALTLAEKDLEVYRTMAYGSIQLSSSALSSVSGTDAYVTSSSAQTDGVVTNALTGQTTGTVGTTATLSCASATGSVVEGQPIQYVPTSQSPDHRCYRIDTYVATVAATGSSTATKKVWVVVRDPAKAGLPVVGQNSSTFAAAGTNATS